MRLNYSHTVKACYIGYIVQAIINNLSPLLFLTFQSNFGISLERIGLLISINFGTQILVDLAATKFVDRIGYRPCVIAAHVFSAIGLVCLALLPGLLPFPYVGLVLATMLLAIGGGLIEVLISPIVESMPGDEKARAMSLLHSFYCWGHVAVVLLSTLFFVTIGTKSWYILPLLWAIVPLLNIVLFSKVPLRPIVEGGEAFSIKALFSQRMFPLLLVLMICAGASEQAMSQWSSLFAEAGLGVSKTVGDLLGPCAFAIMMGLGRMAYGIFGSRIKIGPALAGCGLLTIASYLLTILSPNPFVSLVGCAFCGLGVSLMWPGVFSLGTQRFPQGGTAMFALFALAGDVGCAAGPGLVGLVSGNAPSAGGIADFFSGLVGGDPMQIALRIGLMCAMLFPLAMVLGIALLSKKPAK